MSNQVSPAFVHTSLRAIHEFLIADQRFGLDPEEQMEEWAVRVQNGLSFGVVASSSVIFKLDFDRLAVSFASHLDALGAVPCIQWVDEHLVIGVKDGRLKHRATGVLRPYFQELVLLFLGRSQELLLLHAGTHSISVVCKDERCAAPAHLVVESRPHYLTRNRCNGPPCDHEGIPCSAEEDRLPPVLPKPQAAPKKPMSRAKKVALIKRESRVVTHGVRGMCGKAVELLNTPEEDDELLEDDAVLED